MASVIDAIRSVYQESFSLLKLGGFSFVVFSVYSILNVDFSFGLNSILAFIAIFYLYSGFSSIIINNRINQRIQALPSFDVVYFINISAKAFSLSFPYVLFGYFIANMMVSIFNFEGVPQIVAIWLIRFAIFSLMASALIAFSNNCDLKDGLNLSKILPASGDVFVYTLICIISLALLTIFIAAPTLICIYNFCQFGPAFQYIAVFFLTTFLAVLSDYWGQLHYDIESKNNYY